MNAKAEHTIKLIRARERAHLVAPRKRLPRMQHPTTLAMDYGKALQPIVDRVHAMVQRDLLPLAQRVLDDNARAHERRDATMIDLTQKIHEMSREVADWLEPKELWWLANKYGQQTSDFQRQQLSAATRASLGVDLNTLEPNIAPKIDAWTADNVSLIRSIPTEHLSDVEGVITDALKGGRSWSETADDLAERYGITQRHANLIARDQIGKLNGQLNEERQTALGVTGYIWRTSMDSRVRDEHEEREGQAFEWNDPPDDGNPGEPIQCRCYAEPDFTSITAGLDD